MIWLAYSQLFVAMLDESVQLMCWFSLKWREGSPLASIPPFGAGIFKASRSTDPLRIWKQRKEQVPALPFIFSMSPPGYPSAWLRPAEPASVSPGKIIVASPRPSVSTSGWAVSHSERQQAPDRVD
jgi:hypothetical protein